MVGINTNPIIKRFYF